MTTPTDAGSMILDATWHMQHGRGEDATAAALIAIALTLADLVTRLDLAGR